MLKLTNEELLTINGGVNWAIIAAIGGAVTFLIGVIDGIFRPLKCYKKRK